MNGSYVINEIFYSIQGEGIRSGTANVFVRFSGCNQTCRQETHGFDCDTEFVSGRKLTAAEVEEIAREELPPGVDVSQVGVIFTGGEPGLQLDQILLQHFRSGGWGTLAIETNGSVNLEGLELDWITVSPKVAEHAIRQLHADEVKYVRGHGQGIPKTVVQAEFYLISPAFDGLDLDPRAVAWCVGLVKEHPKWRLSLQLHKWLKVR